MIAPRRLLIFAMTAVPCLSCVSESPDTASEGSAASKPVVGFRVDDGYDHGRDYRFERAPDGSELTTPGGRPMQVGIWYPARASSDTRMSLGAYSRIAARADDPASPRAKELADAAFRALTLSPNLDPATLDRPWNRETAAYLDAPPRSGRFPVVLMSMGSGAPWHNNYGLAEALADRGYVVLASRSAGAHHPYMSLDQEGVETAVDDLSYLAALAHSLPFADRSRCGVIGRSWGAVPAIVYAARNPSVDAIVSLDGTVSYNFEQLREGHAMSGFAGGEFVRDPIFVAVGEARPESATPIDRTTYFENVSQADAYLASYHAMQHASFASRFLDLYFAPAEDPADPHRKGHAALVEDVGRFLDHYVTDGDGGLVDWPVSDDEVRTIESDPSDWLRPAPDAFSRAAFDFGAEAAIELHHAVVSEHPEDKPFGWRTLDTLCELLIEQGCHDDAANIARFGAEQYPDRAIFITLEGKALLAAGETQRAREILERALNVDDAQSTAEALLERMLD